MVRSKRQAGQTLVFVTFGLVVLLGAAGLAIDMGYLRYQKRLQQSAADSAALAAANDLAYVPDGANLTNTATNDATLNGFTGANVTVTVNHPPATGPFAGAANTQYVEVLISVVQPTFFTKIFGVQSATVTARAVALDAAKNCVYGLSTTAGITPPQPLSPPPPCGVIDNLVLVGEGAVPAADPLAYLQPPAPGGCLAATAGLVNDGFPLPTTMNPVPLSAGNYCGGISVSGKRSVNLGAGIYNVTGVGISFTGKGTVSGSDVTFYLGGGAGTMTLNGRQGFNLVAPTTDPYAGILFYQDRTNASAATISGAGGSRFQGAFYFPGAALTLNGGGTGAAYMIFVAQSLTFGTILSFPANYASLPAGSPIKTAVLVE